MSKPIKNLQLFNDLCAVEDTLIKRGWCKDTAIDIGGSVCLMKAASLVTESYPRLDAVDKALRSVIGRCPVRFNDHSKTTFNDILAKLREAREVLVSS